MTKQPGVAHEVQDSRQSRERRNAKPSSRVSTALKWSSVLLLAMCAVSQLTCCKSQDRPAAAGGGTPSQAQSPNGSSANQAWISGDIVELVQQKKIEVTTSGDGIESVTVRLHRLVKVPLNVQIPVGTYFVSAQASAQNMITTQATTAQLTDDEWQGVSTPVACTNRPKDAPDSSDSFTVERAPHQEQLAKLMPVLDAAGVSYPVRQAAVWIVTDDADFSDLGELVESSNGFDGSRVINEPETAQAMMLCDKAGIDITRKAIWRDRETILASVTDPDVKAWLQQKH